VWKATNRFGLAAVQLLQQRFVSSPEFGFERRLVGLAQPQIVGVQTHLPGRLVPAVDQLVVRHVRIPPKSDNGNHAT
jgi:hypothetical protein